ncbi:DUF4157 domain-containing protein [Trinickia sp. YCB016]
MPIMKRALSKPARAEAERPAPAAQPADGGTGLVSMGEYSYSQGVVQRQVAGSMPPPSTSAAGALAADAKPANRTGLPRRLKAGVEALSGVSLDHVRVHYRSPKPAQLQAHAYAKGAEIHLAPGQERHLPHEAWHAAQQAQGRVRPTFQLKGDTPVNDHPDLEREADRMGAAALRWSEAQPLATPAQALRVSTRSVGAGVIQGVFTYEETPVDSEEAAEELAGRLYDTLSEDVDEPKMTRPEFIKAIQELATSGDHGELEDDYFKRLITDGLIRETFPFESIGRRVHTRTNAGANFPPQRSVFHRKLRSDTRSDLSYAILHDFLQQALAQVDEPEHIKRAIAAALENFNPGNPGAVLDPGLNADLQLVVQHLLKYQSFNHPALKDTSSAANQAENEFRALLLEQTKLIISRTAQNLRSIVPRDPDFDSGASLYDALPAPIDVNRPLAHSVFSDETYKAVYKITQKVLRGAHDLSQAEPSTSTAPRSTEDRIAAWRPHLNRSFFDAIEGGEYSSIPKGGGQKYAREHLHLPYDEDAESFDEGSSDISSDPGTDDELFDADDTLAEANVKRRTAANTFGTFVKLTEQKKALDEQDEANKTKFRRLQKGVRIRTKRLNKHYKDRFDAISKEADYRSGKISNIERRIETLRTERLFFEELLNNRSPLQVKDKLKSVGKDNPAYGAVQAFLAQHGSLRANTIAFKTAFAKFVEKLREEEAAIRKRLRLLKGGEESLSRKRTRLDAFYNDTPVGDIISGRTRSPRGWRSRYTEIFGDLGDEGLDRLTSRAPPVPLGLDEAAHNGRVYAPNAPGIRDTGECLWDTLRVRYGISTQNLQTAAGDAGLTFEANTAVDELPGLIDALCEITGRDLELVVDIFDLENLAYLRTDTIGHGNDRMYIALFWHQPSVNGHFVPPKEALHEDSDDESSAPSKPRKKKPRYKSPTRR